MECLFSVAELEELLEEIRVALSTEKEEEEAAKVTSLDLRGPHTRARICKQLQQFSDAAHAYIDEMRELEQSYIIKHGYVGEWFPTTDDEEAS